MFLIKLCLGVACVYLCSKIAVSKANSLKESYLFWESVVKLCNILLQEFSYKKRPIKIAVSTTYSSTDFKKLLNDYVSGNDITFPKYLTDAEAFKFKTFLYELGKSDSETQKLALNSYKTDFESIVIDKKLEYKKTNSVTLKVGFSVGFMMLIMVI